MSTLMTLKMSRFVKVFWNFLSVMVVSSCITHSQPEYSSDPSGWRWYEVRASDSAGVLVKILKKYESQERLDNLMIQESYPIKVTFRADEQVIEELQKTGYPITESNR